MPLAATGGIAALWLRGMPFTISAAVGFITALAGHRRPQRHHARQLHQPAPPRGPPAPDCRDRGHAHLPAPDAGDHARGIVGLHSDGHRHGPGCRGAAPWRPSTSAASSLPPSSRSVPCRSSYDWIEGRQSVPPPLNPPPHEAIRSLLAVLAMLALAATILHAEKITADPRAAGSSSRPCRRSFRHRRGGRSK